MHELLSFLISFLKEQLPPRTEICSSFDAVPVSSKSGKLFIVVSPQAFRLGQAFPDGSAGVLPFTAEFRLSLLAPMTVSAESLSAFFHDILVPALLSADCVLCEIQTDAPKADLQLRKLVCSGIFRIKGLYLPEQEEIS